MTAAVDCQALCQRFLGSMSRNSANLSYPQREAAPAGPAACVARARGMKCPPAHFASNGQRASDCWHGQRSAPHLLRQEGAALARSSARRLERLLAGGQEVNLIGTPQRPIRPFVALTPATWTSERGCGPRPEPSISGRPRFAVASRARSPDERTGVCLRPGS